MKIIEITSDSTFSSNDLGGKGYNLQQLAAWNFPVPRTYAVPSNEAKHISEEHDDSMKQDIARIIPMSRNGHFAVRSSGVGEDGIEHSFAGIFETELDVRFEELSQAIRRVYKSKDTSVTAMYHAARNTAVSDMAVLIQEMVEADYAGVAFSVNPVELDRRIALIEMVTGTGEKLVSGKVRPTSVRMNKHTGMLRVLQKGTDEIDEGTVRSLSEEVGNLLLEVEKRYGQPVDIEWAMHRDKLYLLQARPITTLEGMK